VTPVRKPLLFLAAVFLGPVVLAQQTTGPAPPAPATEPTFEVASIKPNQRNDGKWRAERTADGYSAKGVSLLRLIQDAFEIFDRNLISGGPAWLDTDTFDLEAKLNPADIPHEPQKLRDVEKGALRALLAERFNLRVHHSSKEFPVFNLIIAKGGPRLHEVRPEDVKYDGCFVSRSGYEGCSMAAFANWLRYKSGRTVLDKTGLTGRYDFSAHWTSDATTGGAESSGPSIFTALQEQLGLKLEPSTAPLDILVIDSAEKPSES
jgi:uncharacterized protein (TIGR03435 family)